MKRKMRKELMLGLFLLGVTLTLKQFTATPEFVIGALMGLSINLEIVGALPDKAYNSLKRFKNRKIKMIDSKDSNGGKT